ncbi:hypothetical protein QL285_089567 [Trifolium repens]|jgi:hypothetical protein|nr:hypothetical protein QL285_089567 [Trifolium repens]
MEGYQSGRGTYSGDGRRVEVVMSGKGYGSRSQESSTQRNEKPWRFSDPDTKRKKRIAKYKVHSFEGKVKATLQKGLRWIKNKCSRITHGY